MSEPDAFDRHRNLLFTVAYEMLGSAADAEDVVQETWLRWSAVDPSEVADQRAYLVRITTRLALNRLRTLSRQREDYVGPWLPEPLLTTPDVADDVALADSVSTAMLLVLETLRPVERAVFVLREVFDVPYDEIATAVDKAPATVRQIAHRAREHVAARRPRAEVTHDQGRAVVARFVDAAQTGNLADLISVLAPDVVLTSDGGGLVSAALRPIEGIDKVVRFLAGISGGVAFVAEPLTLNGTPGVAILVEGQVILATTMLVRDGKVVALYLVRNPEKLDRLATATALTRA